MKTTRTTEQIIYYALYTNKVIKCTLIKYYGINEGGNFEYSYKSKIIPYIEK